MRTGSSPDVPPWPVTCTSGKNSLLQSVSQPSIHIYPAGLQSASPPSVRSTASARATAALLLTGAREPAVLPGRLSRPWRDWSSWRRIPTVGGGWPARAEETWTESLLSWRPRPELPRWLWMLSRHHLSFLKCWINEEPRSSPLIGLLFIIIYPNWTMYNDVCPSPISINAEDVRSIMGTWNSIIEATLCYKYVHRCSKVLTY